MRPRLSHFGSRFASSGLAALTLVCATASGQPLVGDNDRAREEFQRGYRALVADHYGEALAHFEASYRIQPNPEMLFNIGVASRSLGRYLDARDAWRRYIEASAATTDPARMTLVRSNLADAERQLARIVVLASQPGAGILIDGRTQDGTDVLVDPGTHVVQCEIPAHPPQRREVRLAPGERTEVSFTFVVSQSHAPPVVPLLAVPVSPRVVARRGPFASPVIWVGLGVAVSAGVTAGVLGLTGNTLRNGYVAQCVGTALRPDCPELQRETQSSLDTRALGANVLLGVAGAGLAVATLALVIGLTRHETRGSASTRLTLAPQRVGFEVAW